MSDNNVSKAIEGLNNIVVSLNWTIKNNVRYAGVSIYNTDTHEFFLCEYIENDYFTILESILVQARPITFLFLSSGDPVDEERVKHIIRLCEIRCEELSKNEYVADNIENDLGKLLKDNDIKNSVAFFDLTLACKSTASIIKYLSLLNDDNASNNCCLRNYNLNEYVRLDKAAVSALNIYTEPSSSLDRKAQSTITLYTFLNKCKTKIGERKLLVWITHPLNNVQKINERLDLVELLKEDGVTRSIIQSDYLRKISDLQMIVKKLKTVANRSSSFSQKSQFSSKGTNSGVKGKNPCSLEDLIKVYDSVIISKKIFYCLNDYKGKFRETLDNIILNPLKNTIMGFESFLKLVEVTIDFEEIEMNNFLISRKFDPTLEKLASEKELVYNSIKDHRTEVQDDINNVKGCRKGTSSKEDIRLVECNVNLFLFRAMKKDQNIIQQRKKVYHTVRMNKNEILFNTNRLKELCKTYEHILHEYNIVQKDLSDKAIEVASSYWELIEKLSEVISTLDVICAFAFVSATSVSTYVRPVVEEEGKVLEMKASRHALIESNLFQKNFIPNDIFLDKEKKRLNIITGPNMGGKSTFIRQVALICFMAQIGSFVPCASARLPLLSQIMCRVGSSDIQLKGISTFFSEMIEVSAIVKNANEKTLVIIDELGRGTSTYEGFGISWSVAHYLLNTIKCFCLFATHFHEMANLEDEQPGVINSHVAAKVDSEKRKISFLYEVKKGYADKSYGVHVAEIAKLPKNVIDKAFEKSKELESVENRHYFQTKMKEQKTNENQNASICKQYETLLKTVFNTEKEQEFINNVKKHSEELKNVLNAF